MQTAYDYRFYFDVYVYSVGRFTPVYMALIDAFRKLVVSVTTAPRPRDLEPNLRHGLTTERLFMLGERIAVTSGQFSLYFRAFCTV